MRITNKIIQNNALTNINNNKILEDKLSNLDNLKNDVGVSYKNDKMKLFVGDV